MSQSSRTRPFGWGAVIAAMMLLLACEAGQTSKSEEPPTGKPAASEPSAAAEPGAAKCSEPAAGKPPVEVTTIPPVGGGPDRQELIAGCINLPNPGSYRISVWSHTDRWYVEPYVAAPLLEPDPYTGRWQARIFLGAEYAVMLVRPSYKPPATMLELPRIGGDVVYIARVPARQ
jgi:hypothetical protein